MSQRTERELDGGGNPANFPGTYVVIDAFADSPYLKQIRLGVES